MVNNVAVNQEYREWLKGIKGYIRNQQVKAAVRVNEELLKVYWKLGEDICIHKAEAQWGSGFYESLSKDLKTEFPDMKGFSITNLKYCKRFYELYNQSDTIRQQIVDEFTSPIFTIPWGHHTEIIAKCKSVDDALFYVHKTIENGWSRAVLLNFLDAKLHQAEGKAITNFTRLLPPPVSDLAQQTLKDPYNFDFLTIRQNYDEKELQEALTNNITKFLLELGNGFAYVGQQYRLKVGEQEFFADLLFYHLKLRCYVVIELKVERFKPEHLGQLGFYVTAIDKNMKSEVDNPTIGLLICKTKDSVVAEYALGATTLPIGISEYELKRVIPDEFKGSLPTIEEIEEKLGE
jgi:predicted nuclease of restriction endonuclease-like (RecB) superfamily